MRKDASNKPAVTALFRRKATESAVHRLFGSVTVIVPPSGYLAFGLALLALLALAFVAWYVEIPQRVKAVGVLMPPDGLLDIVADTAGRIGNIYAGEGEDVGAGDLLLTIATDRKDLAQNRLQSLHAEIALLNKAHARQLELDRNQLLALDEESASFRKRLVVARTEYKLQQHLVEINQRRLARREGLAGNGSIAADALDQERFALLQAKTGIAAIQHVILGYEKELAGIERSRADAKDEATRRKIQHDLELRRLDRQILEQRQLISREIRAPQAVVVARINVRSGTAVAAGETLMKVYRRHQELEAWLYLSSAKAGFLRKGQAIELHLDAYPHQLFGTSSAVVTSISNIAIVPQDVRVPLALSGPVFEVRARLEQSHVKALHATWPLAPGTSFQAELIQRRYRLYEWLLRIIVDGSGGRRA